MMDGIDYIDDSWLRSGLRWYGKCKSVKAEDDSSSNSLTLTVEFDVYPFALRKIFLIPMSLTMTISQTIAPTIGQATIFTEREIFLINMGANASSPTIKATSTMQLTTDDGITIKVPKGESQDYFFKLKEGLTT